LKVRDQAGNENKCGQISSPDDGTGPAYVYNYGAALRFTTPELYEDPIEEEKYLVLSEDESNPTRFAAGPFIAGEEIKFDKLYYSYASSSGDAEIYEAGGGAYTASQIVFFVNYDNELSENQKFPLQRVGESQNDEIFYPATKITQSLNAFRPDIYDEFNQDYFLLDENFLALDGDSDPANTIYNQNDFFLGYANGKVTNIKTGYDPTEDFTEPILLTQHTVKTNPVGRLQNLGILNGLRSNDNSILTNKILISYIRDGLQQTYWQDTSDEAISEIDADSVPVIKRGFTKVAGRYQVRLAIQTTETTTQYFEVNFDIFPNEPNFDCSTGECSDLKLTKPEEI
jgi:hypothetical protein